MSCTIAAYFIQLIQYFIQSLIPYVNHLRLCFMNEKYYINRLKILSFLHYYYYYYLNTELRLLFNYRVKVTEI